MSPPASMRIRIAFIGDSFVLGTGDPEHLGWVGRVCASATQRGHDITGYNLGVRRDTSADVRTRWSAEATARLPTTYPRLLVFSLGVNDAVVEDGRRRVALAETRANAGAILGAARAVAPCLFVGPPPTAEAELNARITDMDAMLSALCREHGIPFLPVFGTLLDVPEWRNEVAAGDGAHPAAAGYAALAALVDNWAAWRERLP